MEVNLLVNSRFIQGVNSLKCDNSGWKAFSAGDVCYAKISACFYSYKIC